MVVIHEEFTFERTHITVKVLINRVAPHELAGDSSCSPKMQETNENEREKKYSPPNPFPEPTGIEGMSLR